MRKITIIGSLNMDMVIRTDRVPVMGETILGGEFSMVPGGKGANQAIAAARLGGNVKMVGCVGNDVFGKDLINHLSIDKVNVEHVKIVDGISTGVAVITIKDGDNSIIVSPGANSKLSPNHISEVEETIKGSDILVLQLEIPLETVHKVIEIAKENNVKVILNPAPAISLSDHLLTKINIITPNESECEILTGIPIHSVEDARSAVATLNRRGVEQVIITLGHNGVVYNNEKNIIHKPSKRVEVVDTTAAGDAFTGALAFALSEGKSIDQAVDLAIIVGALTVTRSGAQTSIPYRDDLISNI